MIDFKGLYEDLKDRLVSKWDDFDAPAQFGFVFVVGFILGILVGS